MRTININIYQYNELSEAADVYNKHNVSMQDAYYFAAWPYFEAAQ